MSFSTATRKDTDMVYEGIRIPPTLDTVTSVNFVLTQEAGKLKPKDLKVAIERNRAEREKRSEEQRKLREEGGGAGMLDLRGVLAEERLNLIEGDPFKRQLREMAFLADVDDVEKLEIEKGFRISEDYIGSTMLSQDDVDTVYKQRKLAMLHKRRKDWRIIHTRNQTSLYAPTHDHIKAGATIDTAKLVLSTLNPHFDTNRNDIWAKRLGTLRRFISLVSKWLIQKRVKDRMGRVMQYFAENGALTRADVLALIESDNQGSKTTLLKNNSISTTISGNNDVGITSTIIVSSANKLNAQQTASLTTLVFSAPNDIILRQENNKKVTEAAAERVRQGLSEISSDMARRVLFPCCNPKLGGKGSRETIPIPLSASKPVVFDDRSYFQLKVKPSYVTIGYSSLPLPTAPIYFPVCSEKLLRQGGAPEENILRPPADSGVSASDMARWTTNITTTVLENTNSTVASSNNNVVVVTEPTILTTLKGEYQNEMVKLAAAAVVAEENQYIINRNNNSNNNSNNNKNGNSNSNNNNHSITETGVGITTTITSSSNRGGGDGDAVTVINIADISAELDDDVSRIPTWMIQSEEQGLTAWFEPQQELNYIDNSKPPLYRIYGPSGPRRCEIDSDWILRPGGEELVYERDASIRSSWCSRPGFQSANIYLLANEESRSSNCATTTNSSTAVAPVLPPSGPTITDYYFPDTDRHKSGLTCYNRDHLRGTDDHDNDIAPLQSKQDALDYLTDSESDNDDDYDNNGFMPSLALVRKLLHPAPKVEEPGATTTIAAASSKGSKDNKPAAGAPAAASAAKKAKPPASAATTTTVTATLPTNASDNTSNIDSSNDEYASPPLQQQRKEEQVELLRDRKTLDLESTVLRSRKAKFDSFAKRLCEISQLSKCAILALPVQMPFHSYEEQVYKLMEQRMPPLPAHHVEVIHNSNNNNNSNSSSSFANNSATTTNVGTEAKHQRL